MPMTDPYVCHIWCNIYIPSTKTPVMLAYIPAPWILYGMINCWILEFRSVQSKARAIRCHELPCAASDESRKHHLAITARSFSRSPAQNSSSNAWTPRLGQQITTARRLEVGRPTNSTWDEKRILRLNMLGLDFFKTICLLTCRESSDVSKTTCLPFVVPTDLPSGNLTQAWNMVHLVE